MSLTPPMSVTSLDRTETQVDPSSSADLDRLLGSGLDVRSVHASYVLWAREPSPEHKALAESLLGRTVAHAV